MDLSSREEWNVTFSKDFHAKQVAQRKFAKMDRYNLRTPASWFYFIGQKGMELFHGLLVCLEPLWKASTKGEKPIPELDKTKI